MVASVAPFGRLGLMQAVMARAVAPAADAPIVKDRPRPSAAQHAAATVAFAPAAMHALLQAQEQMDKNAPILARTPTVIAIDQLIVQMADGRVTAAPTPDAPLTLRRLETARLQLAEA
ncbi:MAG TPA: hypothetical protein VNW53_02005 [Phenylobacterium sp.]|uniref:hypothetical protein n=1 Tax=Phenylobacterium sp. TaxID=1871053 RepID=UPI002B9E7EB6|nr:hypothetical protein [Phenylobacterium sp.]HXA37749.1 hypothetical protein [Phenylobacterium sp.]